MTRTGEVNIEDHSALLAYLRDRDLIQPDEKPIFHTLAGGVSNRTVWVQHAQGEDWVLKQALEKLRVQVDWFSAPERIQREAAGLRRLSATIPGHVPALVYEDSEHHILAMTAVPQPHENWKNALLRGCTDVRYARSFGSLLAQIHNAVEHHSELAQEFAERRFFEELRLEPYYGYSATQAPEAHDFLQQLIEDTRLRRFTLAHGDYSPKNVLICQDSLTILDFEVIHFGDPAFDIGFSLTHFLSKAHHLPTHRASFMEMAYEYWQTYLETVSPGLKEILKPFAARHTLACILARVAGRSPLEYLNETQRERQMRIALELMRQDISDIPQLISAFGERLGPYNE